MKLASSWMRLVLVVIGVAFGDPIVQFGVGGVCGEVALMRAWGPHPAFEPEIKVELLIWGLIQIFHMMPHLLLLL